MCMEVRCELLNYTHVHRSLRDSIEMIFVFYFFMHNLYKLLSPFLYSKPRNDNIKKSDLNFLK